MEFDQNSIFDGTSLLVMILLAFVTCITVFYRLKVRWPLKVNCWFCNSNTKIWRQELDWWLCPSCEQYNGFSKDGDYAYDIPEQHRTALKKSPKYCTTSKKSGNAAPKKSLCSKCNNLEGLKLLELSNFEPEDERTYDHEVKEFERKLEKKYRLCGRCTTTVRNVLQKQALWLAQYKVLFFKGKSVSIIIDNAKKSEKIFRIISTIFDSMIVYNSVTLPLALGGLFFQLCACWASPTKRRGSDILLAFLWICIIILIPFKELKLMKTNMENDWLLLEYVTQYHVVTICAFIIGFVNMKPISDMAKRNAANRSVSFKRLESREKNNSPFAVRQTSDTGDKDRNSSGLSQATDSQFKTTRNIFMPPLSTENPVATDTSIFSQNLYTEEPIKKWPSQHTANNIYFNGIFSRNNTLDNFLLNDSLSTLSTLSLSEETPNYTNKSPKLFEKRVYSTKRPDLFKKSSSTSSSKRYILAPPKLKSVMQTSWVAGGYWQEGIDAPSLSRSSSQSSGFGSAGSNFAPSREQSIQELDQCSVTSDATQSCYTSKPNSNSSTLSLSATGPFQQVSSVFAKTNGLTPGTCDLLKLPRDYSYSQGFLPSPQMSQNYRPNAVILNEHTLQGRRISVTDVKDPLEIPMFPNHTTIVTSPVWLPALLCGSLILNIIVLCATLLR